MPQNSSCFVFLYSPWCPSSPCHRFPRIVAGISLRFWKFLFLPSSLHLYVSVFLWFYIVSTWIGEDARLITLRFACDPFQVPDKLPYITLNLTSLSSPLPHPSIRYGVGLNFGMQWPKSKYRAEIYRTSTTLDCRQRMKISLYFWSQTFLYISYEFCICMRLHLPFRNIIVSSLFKFRSIIHFEFFETSNGKT